MTAPGHGVGDPSNRALTAPDGETSQAPVRTTRRAKRSIARPAAALRRIPRAGWTCFLIAFVNAAIWGALVPPFQVPDEVTHFAYAQYLAQTGRLPFRGAKSSPYSTEEEVAIDELQVVPVMGHAEQRGIITPAEGQAVHHKLSTSIAPVGPGGVSAASVQPPLYYALETIPYWLSPSHELLARLALMRLMSALIAGLTVLTIFLFLRELMPRARWAWTVGALAVAFQPAVNFIAAGVNGDNLLFLTSAVTLLLLLRTYRRGLTMRRGVAIGVAVAAGVLSKLTFIGLLPGIAAAVLLLTWRALPSDRRAALRALAATVSTAAAPVALYVLLNLVAWHRGLGAAGVTAATNSRLVTGHVITLGETLEYTWELYLPSLGLMQHVYFGANQLSATWLEGLIGHFGWLDYTFPAWVYTLGKSIFLALTVLAIAGLVRLRHGVRRMLPLFACFGVVALGLLGEIGYTGIRYQLETGFGFAQTRYLFPLLAFYALFVVLAANALPRRWAPVAGAVLVILTMAHGLFSETLTISRYYG
ncbi:MAG: DUF2142 domain-containing protein [Solirubrobacteraceae bacterium]